MKKYFGTDGIRGIPQKTLEEEIVKKVCSSVEKILKPQSIALISDTRESCDLITDWIIQGFSDSVRLTNYGVLPSGAIPILINEFDEDLGIIISASHNPSEYNGIKLIGKNGSKLDDEIEIKIENEMDNILIPEKKGIFQNSLEGYKSYLDFLNNVNDIDFDKFDLVIDSANGSAYKIIEDLLASKEANFNMISNNPDGKNIHKECGATYPSTLQTNMEMT